MVTGFIGKSTAAQMEAGSLRYPGSFALSPGRRLKKGCYNMAYESESLCQVHVEVKVAIDQNINDLSFPFMERAACQHISHFAHRLLYYS